MTARDTDNVPQEDVPAKQGMLDPTVQVVSAFLHSIISIPPKETETGRENKQHWKE